MRLRPSLGLLLLTCCPAFAQTASSAPAGQASQDSASQPGLYLKVRLDTAVKVSALKSGDVIEGKLAQPVYSGDREIFPVASRVRMTVDKLARRRREPNDHWPWVVQFFTPRHQNYPTFQSATVSVPDGSEVPLHVSLIFINREREIHAPVKTETVPQVAANSAPSDQGKAGMTPAQTASQSGESTPAENKATEAKNKHDAANVMVTLEATYPAGTLATSPAPSPGITPPGPVTLVAGTRAQIILLGGVSASSSRPGDSFQARLVEPVRLDSRIVLPEGTLLKGKVVKRTPPRMLSRAGSLLLTFTDLTLPGSADISTSASVTAAQLDQSSHTRIDPEGKLQGERPGKAWMLINIGATAGIAKIADDGTQLLVEAIVETATDASTAGTARIVATCASGLFILTRHGRDVVLPKFTQMNIVFDRPVSLSPLPVPATDQPAGDGKKM